jgi:hypothetical protein
MMGVVVPYEQNHHQPESLKAKVIRLNIDQSKIQQVISNLMEEGKKGLTKLQLVRPNQASCYELVAFDKINTIKANLI